MRYTHQSTWIVPKHPEIPRVGRYPLYPSFLDIRTLAELSLRYKKVKPHLDTLLELLEGNHSLERVKIKIYFKDFPTPFPQVRAAIANRIQRLSISPPNARIARTLISSIPLQRGAHLKVKAYSEGLGLNNILSGISITHLSNLQFPTSLEYRSEARRIRLDGPNGSLSYHHDGSSPTPFIEFPVLPLIYVQRVVLVDSSHPWHSPRHSSPPSRHSPSRATPIPTYPTSSPLYFQAFHVSPD